MGCIDGLDSCFAGQEDDQMLPLPGHKSVPIDTEEYRRQADEAFRHAGREWDAVYGISSDLYSITETAARFARQRDYTNAAAIYEVVAVRTLSRYPPMLNG
jgi:hypothetical protein